MRRLLMSLLMLCALTAAAQTRKVQNRPFIDERRFHYGFTIGLQDQGLRLANNGYVDPATGAQWLVRNDRQDLGLSVGVLGEWKLSRYLGLRAIPSLYFGSKHLTFRNAADGKTETQDMKSTYIAVPVLLKVSGQRYNNYRPYVVGGVSPAVDLMRKKQAKLLTRPFDMYVEVGLGCDLYLPFFKLIPELKFSFGLGNILQKNRQDLTDATQHVFTESVDRARANMVTLSFYFE